MEEVFAQLDRKAKVNLEPFSEHSRRRPTAPFFGTCGLIGYSICADKYFGAVALVFSPEGETGEKGRSELVEPEDERNLGGGQAS